VVLKSDGILYNDNNKPAELRDTPRIFQQESDYLAGCADSRTHSTPDIHSAMSNV